MSDDKLVLGLEVDGKQVCFVYRPKCNLQKQRIKKVFKSAKRLHDQDGGIDQCMIQISDWIFSSSHGFNKG